MTIIKFLGKVVAGTFVVLFLLSLLLGAAMPTPDEVDAELNSIAVQVATDAVEKYRMAVRSGTAIDRCVQAGFVSAAWLQAQDEAQYAKWQEVELSECKAAGVPR